MTVNLRWQRHPFANVEENVAGLIRAGLMSLSNKKGQKEIGFFNAGVPHSLYKIVLHQKRNMVYKLLSFADRD